MENHRKNFVATGTPLGPGAGLAHDPTDITGLQFLLGVFSLVLLQVWPYDRESKKPSGKNVA